MFLIILRLKLCLQSDGKENSRKLCRDDSFDMCQDQTTQTPQFNQSSSAVQVQSENKSPRTFSPSTIFNNPFSGFFNRNKPSGNIEKSISERKIENKNIICNDLFYDAKEEVVSDTKKITKTTKESKYKENTKTNGKKPEKRKFNVVVFVIVILSIASCGCFGYILYKMFLKPSNTNSA